ncbi:hypothetical protein HDU99_009949, partial [Rhizoclosmatium hyalinum]
MGDAAWGGEINRGPCMYVGAAYNLYARKQHFLRSSEKWSQNNWRVTVGLNPLGSMVPPAVLAVTQEEHAD